MNTIQRDTYWNIARAVLMWLVILGHTIQLMLNDIFQSYPLFKGIYIFHLPVFFFISGYFAITGIQKHQWKRLLTTTQRLLYPVFTIGTIQALLTIHKGDYQLTSILSCYICLWFLWSLFECHVCAHVLLSFKGSVWRVSFLILPIFLSMILRGYIPYASYLSYSWPFFLMGMYFRHKGFSHKDITNRLYWLLPAAAIAFCIFKDDWYIYFTPLDLTIKSWGIATFRFVSALVCGSVFLAIIKSFYSKLNISKIGAATLGIYVVQCIICNTVLILKLTGSIHNIIAIIIISLVTFVASYYIYLITKKIPFAGKMLYGEIVNNTKTSDKEEFPRKL